MDVRPPGEPKRLFDLHGPNVRHIVSYYTTIAPLSDGRFLLIQQSKEEFDGPRKVHVILNFPRLLQDKLLSK